LRARKEPARKERAGAARYAAPVAFLLGVTIAVLLVRSGLGGHSPATTGPVIHATTARVPPKTPTVTGVATSASQTSTAGTQYYTVQTGDTYGSIASSHGIAVTDLEALNPGVSSNSLQVGQRIRVK
jgi:LysM repeat protein